MEEEYINESNVHISGEIKTRTVEADVTRNGQVSDATATGETDSDDAKLTTKSSSAPAAAVATSSDEPATSDDQRGSENETCDARVTPPSSDNGPAAEVAQPTGEMADRSSMSCVRDLINSAIEKTLQDSAEQHRQSQTPPTTTASGPYTPIPG